MKVTDPVGATDVVPWNVAVSPIVVAVPTVIDDGFAYVVSVGDAGPTASNSPVLPHAVVELLLFASPA